VACLRQRLGIARRRLARLQQLPAALGLNGIAMNASRIVGPLTAGMLIMWRLRGLERRGEV